MSDENQNNTPARRGRGRPRTKPVKVKSGLGRGRPPKENKTELPELAFKRPRGRPRKYTEDNPKPLKELKIDEY